MTVDQKEIFEQFCSKYFPYRLNDRYQEEGYFDFRASSFIGMDNGGKDGILLRTDIPYQPMELLHIFLHELAHIYCAHHELDGKSFYDEYCEDYAQTKEEDGIINAGYAVWRECIAETSQTWEKAETAILSLNLFDTPPEMDLFRLVYAQLRTTFLEIDVDFIHELGYLYLNILSLAVIRNLRQN